MDRELRPMLAVLGELEQAGLATLADATQLLGELTFRCGERFCRDILDDGRATAPSDRSQRDPLAELTGDYRAYIRELAACSSWLGMRFLSNLEKARAQRSRPSHSAADRV